MTQLKTLDRGVAALGVIAECPAGLTIPELARALGVHKAIAYRVVATLLAHGLVARHPDGRVLLGGGLVALAARFEPQFRAAAQPLVQELAAQTRAAAFIAVAQGADCVAIMVEQAQHGVVQVTYRLGSRHSLTRGASGLAILAGRAPRPGDPAAVADARAKGYSVTRGELQRGAVGVAAPVLAPEDGRSAIEPCVGVVAMEDLDVARAAAAVRAQAARLRALM